MGKRPAAFARRAFFCAFGLTFLGTATALAEDQDNDGLDDALERPFADTDRDRSPDYLDRDDDGDGIDTADELGANPAQLLDSDSDGSPDYRDADDDGDGVPTRDEYDSVLSYDADHDDIPAYLDADEIVSYIVDADRDGILDADDPDDDNDEVSDDLERAGDSDHDGRPDRVDPDDDGDYVPTRSETESAGVSSDADGDGTADYLDADDDDDGLLTADEDPDPNADGHVDDARATSMGIADYLHADDDGDGIVTKAERPGLLDRDTDEDGKPDHRDADDDGDSRESEYEGLNDADADGILDYLDPDDDGDGIATRSECADVLTLDFDRDGTLNYLDLDSDGDGLSDRDEGVLDGDGDGRPDYLDSEALPEDGGVAMPDAGPCTSCADAGVDAAAGDAGAGQPDAGARDAGRPIVTVVPPSKSDDGGCSLQPQRSERSRLFSALVLLGLVGLLRRRAGRTLLAACAVGPALDGCGGDDPPTVDMPALDGGSTLDAQLGDGANDAASDATGELDGDGQVATDGGLRGECAGDELLFPTLRGEGRTFGAAIDGNRVQLGYLGPDCSDDANLRGARTIQYASFATSGAAEVPVALVSGGCPQRREPLVIVTGDRRSTLFYTSDGARFDLYARNLEAASEPVAQTNSLAREQFLAGAALSGVATVAYVFEAAADTARALFSLQPGQPARELLSSSAGHSPSELALCPLEAGSGPVRGAVAWRSALAPNSGLYVRFLTAEGEAVGEPIALTGALGSLSRAALASHASGGAVVYTESLADDIHELRFRTLSFDGSVGPAKRLTSGNEQVGEFAVTAHRNGYAILYRRVASELNRQSAVRLLFIDERGNFGGSRFVANAAVSGTAMQLFEARDGRLIALWDDLEPERAGRPAGTMTLHAARMTCL